jgi:hypothetical protein
MADITDTAGTADTADTADTATTTTVIGFNLKHLITEMNFLIIPCKSQIMEVMEDMVVTVDSDGEKDRNLEKVVPLLQLMLLPLQSILLPLLPHQPEK